jgi:hypothetical protein
VYVLGSGERCRLHLDARCRRSGLRIERAPAEPRPVDARLAA